MCGFLWDLDGAGAHVVGGVAQARCTYMLTATIQKCQAQAGLTFPLEQVSLNSLSLETLLSLKLSK